MKIKIFYTILLVFLVTASVSFAVGGIPPLGGYTPDLQEIDPNCSQGDTDCFVNLNHQGYIETGSRVNGDLNVIIGDYDSSNNGTRIELRDDSQETKLLQNRLLINTESDALSNLVGASIYQKETGGGKSANEVNTFRDFTRESVFNSSSNYTNQVIRVIDNAVEDSTGGTKTQELINRKTGVGDLFWKYVSDLKNETYQGDIGFLVTQVIRNHVSGTDPVNVSTVMRGSSTNVRIDNPNAAITYPQGLHPTVDFRQGTINGGSQVIYLDIDATTGNLGTSLNFNGDVSYLQGGSGADVAVLKQHLEDNGHKLRFIWNDGSAESDFSGIINYLGDISEINDATNKVLVNKEWVNLNKNKTLPYTVATLPSGTIGDIAHVTDASIISYRGVATGGGSDVALVFFDGNNWLYH